MNIDFVDVSVYQGDIDWQALTVPAIIKATEGSTFVDPKFPQNRDGSRATGKALGWYHFLSSQTGGGAQADHYLATVQPLPSELNCLDWETDSVGVRPDPDQAKQFIDTLRAQGYGNIRLYGNDWLAAYALQWDVPFWCASYTNNEQAIRDRHAVAWQWSSEENVPGIAGHVDVSQVLDSESWYGGMTLAEFVAALGPTARLNNGIIEMQLRDGNWYPYAACVQYIHSEAQDAHNKPASGGGSGPLKVVLEGTATP